MRPLFFVENTAGDVKDDVHMTTMMMMRMMRIEVMMMILMTLTTTMTLNQRWTTRKKHGKEKRWTLLKKDRLRRRFALNSFTFLQFQVWPGKKFNENGLVYLTRWPNWNIWNPFAIFWIFFYSAWNTWTWTDNLLLERPWRSRETQKIYYCVSFEIPFCI